MADQEKEVLDGASIDRAIRRIAHEIVERNRGVAEVALVGIRTGGEGLARRLVDELKGIEGIEVPCGFMDITMYRDDFRHAKTHPVVHKTQISFSVQNQIVVLVDDVFFTGRTIRAAMDGLMDFGRPKRIQMAVMIDRGHRELPIRPDFVGRNLPTARGDRVKVYIGDESGADRVTVLSGT